MAYYDDYDDYLYYKKLSVFARAVLFFRPMLKREDEDTGEITKFKVWRGRDILYGCYIPPPDHPNCRCSLSYEWKAVDDDRTSEDLSQI